MTPKRSTFVLVGVLLVVIGLGVYAFYYGDGVIKERSEQISLDKANLEAAETELAILEDSRDKVQEYSTILDLIDKILPTDKLQSEVVSEINQFASESGLEIQTLTFGNGDASIADTRYSQTEAAEGLQGIRVLTASIQFNTEEEGVPYSSAINFLNKIESNQRKMIVTDLQLSPSPANGNFLVALTLSVDIYLRGAPTQ